ncbi:MAG: hypothetical protein QM564_11965 [Bergeyella sp.]
MENKTVRIFIRIEKDRKNYWKKLCSKRQVSLTQLILDSVENRLLDDERRKILAFIEKQENIFAKVENNINQFARIANAQKFVSENEIKKFNILLSEVVELKKEQKNIFIKILSMLTK